MRYIAFILIFFSFNVFSKSLNTVIIVPDHQGHRFWNFVSEVTQTTAKSLNVPLETIYSENNRFALYEDVKKLIKRKVKPDLVIIRPFLGNIAEVLNLLESNNIKFVTLELTFNKEYYKIRGPGEVYKNWIGNIKFDDKQGGYLLAKKLIEQQKRRNPGQNQFITALGGGEDKTGVSRNNGLIKAANEEKNVKLNQIFKMDWDSNTVTRRFPLINRRYNNTTIYWCASDHMALSVVKQLSKFHKRSDFPLVGGFDWLPQTMSKIKSGDVAVSVGGHFLMGAIALVKSVDHSRNINRFSSNNMEIYSYIDTSNIDEYQNLIEQKFWEQIDFKKYLHSRNKLKREISFQSLVADFKDNQ